MAHEPDSLICPVRPRMQTPQRGELRLAAPAKINLNLLVAPRREDGYHPIDSCVARVTLYDQIVLRPIRQPQIRLRCTGADCGPPERNLAYRAAEQLAGRAGERGVAIDLHKAIPPASGLGGGSSDAAAVLEGLNHLWGLGLTPDQRMEAAAALGSDVPLFFGPPTSRITGRGEHVEPVEVHPFWAVLCLPAISCSTTEVYRGADADGPRMSRQLASDVLTAPPSTWRARLENQLAPAAERLCPELGSLRSRLGRQSGIPACITGSGSAVFLLCDSRQEALAAAESLDEDLRGCCVIVQSNPW